MEALLNYGLKLRKATLNFSPNFDAERLDSIPFRSIFDNSGRARAEIDRVQRHKVGLFDGKLGRLVAGSITTTQHSNRVQYVKTRGAGSNTQ